MELNIHISRNLSKCGFQNFIPKDLSRVLNLNFLKQLAFAISVVLFLPIACTKDSPVTIVESGTEGNLTWKLTDNGILTISGKDVILHYPAGRSMSHGSDPPWAFMPVLHVVIEEGVSAIGGRAFYGCDDIISITIPSTVTGIDFSGFLFGSNFTTINISDKNPNFSSEGVVVFNKTKTVLFRYSQNKQGITYNIPNSINEISDYAFYNCVGLTSVMIPNSVTSIGQYAFWSCTNLTSVNIPHSVTFIGISAFYQTAWYDALPDGLVYLGRVLYCYKGEMPANTKIEVQDGTASFTNYALSSCTGLTSITIPNSINSISDGLFYGCVDLTSVTIPSSVSSIGWWSFASCAGLTSIIIPSSVTSIGGSAFSHSGLTSIPTPNSVTNIEMSTFSYCYNLTSVTIPAWITTIEGFAFGWCRNLTSVTIPASVISFGNYVFCDCHSLTEVINERVIPQTISEFTFANLNPYGLNSSSCTLRVPKASIDAYKAATGWKDFGNIVAIE